MQLAPFATWATSPQRDPSYFQLHYLPSFLYLQALITIISSQMMKQEDSGFIKILFRLQIPDDKNTSLVTAPSQLCPN